jgi:hypothetical protein
LLTFSESYFDDSSDIVVQHPDKGFVVSRDLIVNINYVIVLSKPHSHLLRINALKIPDVYLAAKDLFVECSTEVRV